jgi:dissimilatory sulfite reductase (desulfoviridin) alpha/beta subunit
MEWTSEADAMVGKIPFFVRKKVRRRVEEEAGAAGRQVVTAADVVATQRRYLAGMAAEVKGYQLEACFGLSGCQNRALPIRSLVHGLERLLEGARLRAFLEATVQGELRPHHEFRVSVAECPNACSQPQIKDVGIIGAQVPQITDAPCSQCHECVSACPDGALSLDPPSEGPVMDGTRCLACGRCIPGCPTGTLTQGRRAFRVLLGGKLGRHPRLAIQMPGLYSEAEVLDILARCIEHYKARSTGGQRFAEILKPEDMDRLF